MILEALLLQRNDQGGIFRDKVFVATEYRWQFSIGCIHAQEILGSSREALVRDSLQVYTQQTAEAWGRRGAQKWQ